MSPDSTVTDAPVGAQFRDLAWGDADVWAGVNALLDDYAGVQPDDAAVIAYTPDSREGAALVSVALASRGVDVKRVWMSPLRDEGFLDRFSAALPATAGLRGRLVVLTFERDTMSHGDAIRHAMARHDPDQCTVIRAISTCPALFSEALRVAPGDLSARNTAILERCMAAQTLRIETPGGTALDVRLDNDRYQWVSNRGVLMAGRPVILPAGEVATFPASIDGVLVADFAFNVNVITDHDARLSDHPITVTVEDGRAVRYECADADVTSFITECFRTPNAMNVGELGFGTNWGVATAIRLNSHVNERRPGVHLGFGDHNQYEDVVDYSCPIHIDLIADGGLLWVDDDPVPLDLQRIVPSARPHPTRFRDDDVKTPDGELSADCCGMWDRERGRVVYTSDQ